MRHWSSPNAAERTLHYLRERRDEHGEATASLQDIADALHIGRITAQRAIRRLVDTGSISVSRRGNGPLYPSCYRPHRRPDQAELRRAPRAVA